MLWRIFVTSIIPNKI
jgi:hypothetical protein